MAGIYHLAEVKSKKEIREFHDLPAVINKGDSNWIKPLFRDVESVFNPSVNSLFRNGDAIRWLLRNSAGKCVGRVAAFYSRKIANADQKLVGGMGFFECINDHDAAAV
ncbi:MAG: hypothetical protein ABR531_00265, partial [Bacteroidales bacterium]